MPEITKTEADRTRPTPAFIWLSLAAAVVVVYLFGLNIPFVGPDEARYAQVAREMLERGDWITPTLGGHHWFEKPALLYWLEIASFKLFGVSEFAARLGPALFGLGTIVSLWLLGRSVETRAPETTNHEPRTTNDFPNWLALIAATTLGIMVFSRGASFDIVITFPLTAALVCFFIFDRSSSSGKRVISLVLFYVFIGVALLAKGLIGIVFPFAIVGLYYLLSRRWPARPFVMSLFWGTLVAAAVASVWYVPMYMKHGYEFIDEFIVQHHFQRFTSNKYQHPQPFYFFLWVLPLMTLPWLPFFCLALWKMTKRGLNRRDAETQIQNKETSGTASPRLPISPSPRLPVFPSPLLCFATAWLAVPLLFFSFSGSKLPGYILPAVPAAVVVAGIYISELVERSKRWRNGVLLMAAVTLGGAVLLLVFAVPRFAETDSVRSLIRAADENGYTHNKVIMLHMISHNAEFYAAGRLDRDADGKQRRLSTVGEVEAVAREAGGSPILVLVPLEYLSQLTAAANLKTQVLKDNGETAIAVVSSK